MDIMINAAGDTLAKLAGQMLALLEQRTRSNGQVFWARKDGAPDWMTSVCEKAHGNMAPDDHRYRFIMEALSALAEGDDDGETIEPDIYTYDLLAWVSSRNDRYCYCDDAVAEGYGFENTSVLLEHGQLMEKREVFGLVKEVLDSMVGEE